MRSGAVKFYDKYGINWIYKFKDGELYVNDASNMYNHKTSRVGQMEMRWVNETMVLLTISMVRGDDHVLGVCYWCYNYGKKQEEFGLQADQIAIWSQIGAKVLV